MPLNEKQIKLMDRQRLRGWIIYLLYIYRPKSCDLTLLRNLLDARNFPMSVRKFSEELDYLRTQQLIKILPVEQNSELSELEQEKLIQRYCELDGEIGDECCARLTTRGVNLQEGQFEEIGVSRVN